MKNGIIVGIIILLITAASIALSLTVFNGASSTAFLLLGLFISPLIALIMSKITTKKS